jgi:hypothetical protein
MRHRLIVNTEVFEANGTAERDAALVMLEHIPGTKQVIAGRRGFRGRVQNLKVTPHVAQTWSDLVGEPLMLVDAARRICHQS